MADDIPPPNPTGPLPPTSVIVPSRGRTEMLRATVQSILAGEHVPTELIVVDQSDTPDPVLASLTTDRPCEFRYAWSGERGVSRGRNAGIALARYDRLVFVDDDVFVTPGWFAALVRALGQSPPHTVVVGQVQPIEGETPGHFVPASKTDQVRITYSGRVAQDVLYTSNTALYRTALTEVGVFDERLGPGTGYNGSEDSDLGYRLLRAGYQIMYVPEALMYHRAWRAGEDYYPMRWNYGKGRGAFYAKHFGAPDGYTGWRMRRDIWLHLSPFFGNLRRDRRRAWGDVVLVGGLLSGALHWWWERLRDRPQAHP